MSDNNSDPADEEWYSVNPPVRRFFGNLKWHTLAGLIYASAALIPLFQFLSFNRTIPDWARHYPVRAGIWALLVSLSHPTWMWCENRAFAKWCKGKDEGLVAKQKQWFTSEQKFAEGFWKAVLATYAAAGLLGLAMK